MKFSHIINPFLAQEGTDLHLAQPITFESMRRAKETAKGRVEVELLTTQYPEDRKIIPDYFTILADLERSVLDVSAFTRPQKLPLIGDILRRLYEHSEAEYLIFTNIDIGLMPDFYLKVKTFLEAGADALIINRRRVGEQYKTPEDLPKIFKDKGLPHPGFDCFVFHRDIFTKMRLGEVCVGVPFIGITLAYHLFAFASNFKLYDKEHLTFHIGMEIMPRRDQEYYWHNRHSFNKIFNDHIKEHLHLENLPYSELNGLVRHWKWINNPSLFIRVLMAVEWKAWKEKTGF